MALTRPTLAAVLRPSYNTLNGLSREVYMALTMWHTCQSLSPDHYISNTPWLVWLLIPLRLEQVLVPECTRSTLRTERRNL